MSIFNVRYYGDITRTFRFNESETKVVEVIPINGNEGYARQITERDVDVYDLSPNHVGRWFFRPSGTGDLGSASFFIVYEDSLRFL